MIRAIITLLLLLCTWSVSDAAGMYNYGGSKVGFTRTPKNIVTYTLLAPFTSTGIGSNSYEGEWNDSNYLVGSPLNDLMPAEFTWCGWVKQDSDAVGSGQCFFSRDVGALRIIAYSQNTDVYWFLNGTQIQSSSPLVYGQWFFLCVQASRTDNTKQKIFMNGIEVASGAGVAGAGDDVSAFEINRYAQGADVTNRDGNIRAVSVWNTTLSTAQMQTLMNKQNCASYSQTNLVACWNLDSAPSGGTVACNSPVGCSPTYDFTVAGSYTVAAVPKFPFKNSTDGKVQLIPAQTLSQSPDMWGVNIGTVTVVISTGSYLDGTKLTIPQNDLHIATGRADGIFQFDVVIPADDADADTLDAYIRYDDVNNHDKVQITDETAGNDLSYISVTGGVPTTLGTADIDWVGGQTYTVKVQVSGNNLHKVWVDGVLKIDDATVNNANVAETYVGFKTIDNQSYVINSAQVTP